MDLVRWTWIPSLSPSSPIPFLHPTTAGRFRRPDPLPGVASARCTISIGFIRSPPRHAVTGGQPTLAAGTGRASMRRRGGGLHRRSRPPPGRGLVPAPNPRAPGPARLRPLPPGPRSRRQDRCTVPWSESTAHLRPRASSRDAMELVKQAYMPMPGPGSKLTWCWRCSLQNLGFSDSIGPMPQGQGGSAIRSSNGRM